jgi:hypothetical protein
MTIPSLAPPPGAAPPAPAAPPQPVAHPPLPRQNLDRLYRRVLIGSLAASVLLHLLILLVSPAFIRVGVPRGETDTPFDPSAVRGLRMLELPGTQRPADLAVAEQPARDPFPSPASRPGDRPVPERPHPVTAAPGQARTPSATEGAGNAPARAPLRPGFSDPRLYVTPREIPPPPEPSDHERYMAHLQGRLDAYNDSIGAEAERARRATDWTVTDKNGDKWGVSPGKVHLGGVTLPVPVQLGGSGEQQRAADEAKRQREEIQRGEETRDQRETMKERTRATRERKDAERARKKDPDG